MCGHSSGANLSPQEEQATLLSCQLAFLAEASKNAIAGFSFAGLMFPGGEMPVRIFAGLIFACGRLPVKVCR